MQEEDSIVAKLWVMTRVKRLKGIYHMWFKMAESMELRDLRFHPDVPMG